MEWSDKDVQLVPLSWLKPHEEVKPRNRDKLLEMTRRWGGYTKPLIVDSRTGAILDGHHRHSIAIKLGLNRVPAICVDYLENQQISLDVWPASGITSLSKEEVIAMSLSDDLFPPKTSRHTLAGDTPPIFIPLDVLIEPLKHGPGES
ncbi:MAG TPA: ParB N-terminal domain-containing protein [Poseidonia sp.]|nr:ParB N-terminal domain-containing protein [Poseidonia sp.]